MKTNMLRNSVVLVTLLALGCDSSSGSSKSGGDRGDSGLTLDGQAANQPDAGSPPRDAPFAAADAPGSSVDAPSLAADAAQDSAPAYPDTGLSCGQTGASCLSAADCCGLGCISGVCGALACLSDGVTCTSGGQCCSTICGSNGICAALNPTCKTAGNACTTGAECCNQTCSANQQCASPGQVSYCAQTGEPLSQRWRVLHRRVLHRIRRLGRDLCEREHELQHRRHAVQRLRRMLQPLLRALWIQRFPHLPTRLRLPCAGRSVPQGFGLLRRRRHFRTAGSRTHQV